MKVIRGRNEEISATSFRRQEGEALLSADVRTAARQLGRASAGFGGNDQAPPHRLPVRLSSWKCRMNASLGAIFSLFCLENKTYACCGPDVLSALTACKPWGLLPHPWEDSYWELCPESYQVDLAHLLILEVLDFIWCF